MTYAASDARQQILDTLADAVDRLAIALNYLGEAYERVDDHMADRVEAELFRPVQGAYGRAKATHVGFSKRHGLAARTFDTPSAAHPSPTARAFIDRAVQATGEADHTIASLQDTMLPVEVGDPELRAGLSEVRTLISGVSLAARDLVRTLGR